MSLIVGLLSVPLGLPSHYYACTFNFTGGPRFDYPFCNESLPLQQRLDDLINRMTYEEKSAALDTSNPAVPRLGVPSMSGGESTHGVASGCGKPTAGSTGCPTSFPSGTGLGASFDRSLWAAVGGVIGREARALNNQGSAGGPGSPGNPHPGPAGLYMLDPNINLCRDPRWGRCQEVPSECPVLTSEYTAHLISATQRSDDDPRYLQVASTAKHFSMYDMEGYIPRTDPQPPPASGRCLTTGGCQRWNFDMRPPASDFHDYYLVPFRAAVLRANVESMMCSYNSAYGEPTCANDQVNNGMVREEWGWQGFYVSDCTALELMSLQKWDHCPHPWPSEGGSCTPDPFQGGSNYTANVDATMRASLVQGGIDYNCGALYKTNLYKSLQKGTVTKADIDRAAARVYRTHFRLGFYDDAASQPLNAIPPEAVDSPASRAVALRAARESIVLLRNSGHQNSGHQLLPLQPSSSVAFIGPFANATDELLSNYHGSNTLVAEHSPLQAAKARGLNVTFSKGCNVCDVVPHGFPNMPCPEGKAVDTSGFDAAAAAATAADAAVVFVGLDQTSGAENFDRTELTLPGMQEQLVLRVLAAQPNTIVVLFGGSSISNELPAVRAILHAFFPGELGGDAVVDMLTGVTSPAGKMPVTTYFANFTARDMRETDLRASGGITYLHFGGPVIYPFGHGLSYTTFSYVWTEAPPSERTLVASEAFEIRYAVNVTNTGSATSDCVVLAFTTASVDSHALLPKKRLFDFSRLLNIKPAESRELYFTLGATAVTFTNVQGESVLAFGRVGVEVGDVAAPLRHEFELTSQ